MATKKSRSSSGRGGGKMSPEPGKVTVLDNCYVQIGDNNTMGVADVRRCLADPTEMEKSGLTKDGMGKFLLRSVLGTDTLPFEDIVSNMKTAVSDLSEGKTSRFGDIAGLSLRTFIEKHIDSFDMTVRSGKRTVKVKTKKSKKKRRLKENTVDAHDAMTSDRGDVSTTTQDREGAQLTTEAFHIRGGAEDDSKEADRTLSREGCSIEQPWSVVADKKKQVAKPQREKEKRQAKVPKDRLFSDIVRLNKNCIGQRSDTKQGHAFSEAQFLSLISKNEDRDTLFYANDEVYNSSPSRFMQDVVSMWNTPQRVNSYIILGVKSGPVLPYSLLGIQVSRDDDYYQNIVVDDFFTMKPNYQYYEICYNSKLFGIIEVRSSVGHGTPSICKENLTENQVELRENELWYRQGSRNSVCKPTNPTIAGIYQWFLSPCLTQPSTSATVSKKGKALKNAGTCTDAASASTTDEDDNLAPPGRTFNHFWKCVKSFKKGHFVLISGDVATHIKHLQALSLIPWIAVYDFDVYSATKGLLNATQDFIERKRCLRIQTWEDEAKAISETGTTWCFMRGRQGIAGSRTDDKEGRVEDASAWYKAVRRSVEKNVEQLVRFSDDYSVLTLIVIWPQNERLVPILQKFITRLEEQLQTSPDIVLCMGQDPITEIGTINYKKLCYDFEKSLNVCKMDFGSLCKGIINQMKEENKRVVKFSLPTADGCENSNITEQDDAWLREDLEVLYLSNPYTKGSEESELNEEINKFFRGGTLHWFAWYALEGGELDIERDVMKKVEDDIKFHTEGFKSGVVTLFHAPGSGGTTLAQRLLWKLHDKTPCVHIKSKTASSIEDKVSRIKFLYHRTLLPVVIVIDGEDESFVNQLSRCLKYVTTVIIYVKRHPYSVKEGIEREKDKCFLKGSVSAQEAKKLAETFGERCEGTKRAALQRLKQEVQKGSHHFLYEFGMTTYLHEFKGVVSYVKGYLQLDKNPSKDLLPWQKILGYLSLVYYYGQSSVPFQFFTTLLNKPPNYRVSMEDFKYPEFIVRVPNEGKENNVRICHYIVAQEILEQILTRHTSTTSQRTETLSHAACKRLAKFCVEFIEYCGKKKTKSSVTGTPITHILTKTFIFRDDKDMGDETQSRRKPLLSRVMIDIPAEQPFFTQRLQILEKLTQSFPLDPNFHAHLGRFYAYCRPDEDDNAESCFQKAIQLCEEHIKGKKEDEIDDCMRLTLMHIYHMYGVIRKRQLSRYTGKSRREKPEISTAAEDFNERLTHLTEKAEAACRFFEKSRDFTPSTHDVFLFAYTKEIEVRLQVSEFVKRHYKQGTEDGNIGAFLSSDADQNAKSFILSNIATVENLIMECYTDVELGENQGALQHVIQWYNSLFKQQALRFDDISCEDEIGDRRLKIAQIKLQFGHNNNVLTMLESIPDETKIQEIVDLYEANFNDIERFGDGLTGKSNKRVLDLEYREWIFAIRHELYKKQYSIEDVLPYVSIWYDQLRSPRSLFYLFVMKSLLGFGSEEVQGKTSCLQDAKQLQDDLKKVARLVVRSNYPREWLGTNGVGIKQLIPGNRFLAKVADDKFGKHASLAVCKGTICHPNRLPAGGAIDYDLGFESVRVFFLPGRAGLQGSRFGGRRVEFNLAFSIEHGYEAYNVKLLKQYGCSSCSRRLEMTCTEQSAECDCGTIVHKDDINEVEI